MSWIVPLVDRYRRFAAAFRRQSDRWDTDRARLYERQPRMGVIPRGTKLTDGSNAKKAT
jgi:hypothetical protein